jgi:hypothetical protein
MSNPAVLAARLAWRYFLLPAPFYALSDALALSYSVRGQTIMQAAQGVNFRSRQDLSFDKESIR